MIKTRNGKTKPNDKYNDWTVLGYEFHIGKRWFVVCRCQCDFINVVSVYDLLANTNKSCGVCRRQKCQSIKKGDLFGCLCVIEIPYYDRFRKWNKWRVNVECKCGWIGDVSVKLLLRGRHHHKVCKYYIQGEFNGRWKGYKKICGSSWCQIKRQAEHRKLDFSITIEQAWEQYIKQIGKCALTGWPLTIERLPVNDWYNNITASLDRINSSLGYIANNIQWVHKDVNRSKWDLQEQRYVDLSLLIVTHKNRCLPRLSIDIYKRYASYIGVGNISMSFWNSIKDRSVLTRYKNITSQRRIKRKIVFDLTIEEAWKLYLQQNGRCALTGMPIYFGLPGFGSNAHNLQDGEATASLDRIDSNKGYIADNVQWVHKDVNIMKLDLSITYFFDICSAVVTIKIPSSGVESLLLPKSFMLSNAKAEYLRKKGPTKGKYKGVSWSKSINSYVVMAYMYGKQTFLGHFDNEEEAAHNYDWHAKKKWGDCYLNFPDFDYSNFVPKRIIEITL